MTFVGSIKWRTREKFGPRDTRELIRLRANVPGAEDSLLVGVSRSGFTADAGLDVALTADDLIEAWRPTRPTR